MPYLVFKTNPPVSIAFTFATNLSYTVFLTTSFFAALLSLPKSTATVFNVSTSILSTPAFNLAKSDFASRLDASIHVAPLKSALLHNQINTI